MSVEAVFKSQHPDVLAVHEQWRADVAALTEYRKALSERFGGRQIMQMHGWGGIRVVGLEAREDESGYRAPRQRDDMPGWRLGAKEGYWCPDKRTPEGRALAKEMGSHRAKKPIYPGMPEQVWAEATGREFQSHIYTPGSEMIDGWVWVTWGCGADRLLEGHTDDGLRGKNDRVDPDIWTHVRLSEYHAVKESQEDEAKEKANG